MKIKHPYTIKTFNFNKNNRNKSEKMLKLSSKYEVCLGVKLIEGIHHILHLMVKERPRVLR
jgi:hypothetical protein